MRHHLRGRSAIFLLLISTMLWCGSATGQVDVIDLVPDPDCGACPSERCIETLMPFEAVTFYLVIRNPSLGGVSGWEGVVEYTGSLTAPSWTLAAGLDVDNANDTNTYESFQVGIGLAPAALTPNGSGNVVLATFTAFVLNPTNMASFHIRPVPGSTTFPDAPGYASPYDAGSFHTLTPGSGDFDVPVISINDPDCTVAPTPVFSIGVSASNARSEDRGNRLATQLGASDGLDPLDIPSAPYPPGGYVQVSFPHPEWSSPFGELFDHDVRAAFDQAQDARTWLMSVATDILDQPITLAFTLEDGWVTVLDLRDHETGEVIHLDETGMQHTFQPNPAGLNHFDVTVGASDVPPLEPGWRALVTGWNLIGLPLADAEGTLATVVLDDAGATVYALKHDRAAGYATVPDTEVLEQGRGYWIGATLPFVWTMGGEKILTSIELPLAEGWNMLGYPLWFPSHLNGITVLQGGTRYAWGDAVAAGLVDGTLYGYDGAGYVPTTELAAWHGYWIAALQSDVSLRFRWDEMPTTLQRPWDPFAALDDPDNWRLEVSVADGGQGLALGVCERSSDGFDAFQDRPRAPRAPAEAGGPELWFPRPEWNLPTGEKVRGDVRAPSPARLQVWTAKLAAAEPGPVTLAWDRAAWGGAEDLELYLPQQNRVAVASLRAVGEVVLTVGEEPLELVFRSQQAATGIDDAPAPGGGLRAVPNPFNPRTEIRFTTPRAGRAEVRIFDVAGRCVRTLAAGTLPAGATGTVTWRARDDAGREPASGAYFARLLVDGLPVGPTARLSLIR